MADSVRAFFNELPQHMEPEKSTGMHAVFQFDITGDQGGQWHVVVDDGSMNLQEGPAADPNVTLVASDEDWLKIVNGEMGGQMAVLTGKLKIKGDMGLALKLQSLFGLG
jgi:putative sterol carrier protein